jgi:hypothetical protein
MAAQVRRQELQRDHSTQAFVASLVDPTHGSGAERGKYDVLGDATVLPFNRIDARAPACRRLELRRQVVNQAVPLVTFQ